VVDSLLDSLVLSDVVVALLLESELVRDSLADVETDGLSELDSAMELDTSVDDEGGSEVDSEVDADSDVDSLVEDDPDTDVVSGKQTHCFRRLQIKTWPDGHSVAVMEEDGIVVIGGEEDVI